MKLLYILPEYVTNAGGGIITFYRHFLPLLAAQGHEVRVIVGSGVFAAASPSPAAIDGVQVETLSEARLHAHFENFSHYASMPGLRRLLAGAWAMWEQADGGRGYDAVEATDWGLLFVPWVIEAGPPPVVQLHGSSGQIDMHDPVRGEEAQSTLIRLIERPALARATAIQASSKANASFWRAQDTGTVTRILPAWSPIAPVASNGPKTSRGLVVGRAQKWKGPEVLCDALRLLGPRAPAIDWVGRDMPFGPPGRTMAQHLRQTWPEIWGPVISHLPQRPAADTLQLQAQAAFVIVPSDWDTFNFTCVEAMAAGTPVICSMGAGASELIEDGVNGFTFEKQNPQSLARALDHLLSMDEAARLQLGRAGQATVLSALDPMANARLRVTAYEEAIRSGQRAALPQDDWLRLAAAPCPGQQASSDFLGLIPLRELLGHSAQRLLRKLRGARANS